MVKTITFFFLCLCLIYPLYLFITMSCPLCQSSTVVDYASDKRRTYLQCATCDLVFVDTAYLPTREQEKQEYALHENSFQDEGYRKFLGKVLTALSSYIDSANGKPLSALDFGCGPAPVLAKMLTEKGVATKTYDPFFANTPDVLTHTYDIVTCTEAIEHFHQPHREWACFNQLVADNGVLAIMTKRVIDKARFAQWHYKNDPTHVSFFSESTFRYLAKRDGYTVTFPANDVALLFKQ
jgi:transcription initiation factor TFIIIB Brf1 subunit/transcription initiation factor TFIIB